MKALDLLKTLEGMEKTVFTINDIARIVGKDKNYVSLFIHRLKSKGIIKQIEKGKYFITNTNPFSIASNILYPSYVSFISALSYYGLTTIITRKIYVASLKHRKPVSFDDYEVVFVKLRNNRFFGYKREKIIKGFVFIAEIEKAILDSLFLPKYCSIDELVEAVKKANKEKLLEYGLRMKSKIVLKRLGFILEQSNIDIYEKIKDKINKKYEALDPAMPKKGVKNKKWKLIINKNL